MIHALPATEKAAMLSLLDEYEKSREREAAQSNFLEFVKSQWPAFIYGSHHKVMARAFEKVARGECKRLIINLPPRHCLTLDTPVLTTSGWKTMETVQPGDYVFGPDGLPTLVVGKSDVHQDRQLYRVTTNDGASVVTDAGHRWLVRLDRKTNKFIEYTTEQLWARDQGAYVGKSRSGEVRVDWDAQVKSPRAAMLPDFKAVDLPSQGLLVDPYVLGLWLGDGSSAQAVITSHDDDALLIRPEIERRGYKTTDQSSPMTFGILDLKVKLRELGVLGNKHIPTQYLIGSIEQRKDLMRGLMDSDGNVSKAGQCFFSQKSLAFISQVRELLWSLGIRNTLQVSEAKIYDKSYGETYRLSFYADDLVFLERKRVRAKNSIRNRFIRIEKLNQTGAVQCIEVARDDHLFLAGKGMICTLNTKSELASYMLPAWFLGNFPNKKVIQCSHTAELAVGFGRKVRNLVASEDYQKIFPDVNLQADSKAAGRWSTNKGGEYFAIGIGGAVTGKGADLLIIDDPHSEQEAALGDPAVYNRTYEWYTSGPRQRLQPGGAILIVMTRWGAKDLAGRVLKSSIERGGTDEWEVIELPAILPSGKALWPEFWDIKELESIKAELPVPKWSAQYQQNPTSEEGAIVKREWWRVWEKEDPPPCEFLIQSWDTAFTKKQTSDFSACTTWGVFKYPNPETGVTQNNIILLDAVKERMEFPALKKRAYEMYMQYNPDAFIVEAKAAGAPLIYELRAMGIPVSEFTPSRGNDKVARVNAVSDLFSSGLVWAPQTRWAEEVVEEFASFPNAEHDDLVDSSTQALLRFRQGGFISIETDEPMEKLPRRRINYY
jgi:predicted phage terminase large subunit-like protein